MLVLPTAVDASDLEPLLPSRVYTDLAEVSLISAAALGYPYVVLNSLVGRG